MSDKTTRLPKVLDPQRSLAVRRQAIVNLWDYLVTGGIADTTRTPSEVIDSGRTRELRRYVARADEPTGLPVVLVPPLGAQAYCYDLRQGLSLASDLVGTGRPTYVVDYGRLKDGDLRLGVEHFVNEVVRPAIRTVSDDNDGSEVHVVGWCMGGLFSIVTAALHDDLPIRSVTMIASPFDLSKSPAFTPVRVLNRLTGGKVIGPVLESAGSVPASVVSLVFKATAGTKYLTKPMALWARRDDRDVLGHMQAVDQFMNDMLAYPGLATQQAYHQLALRNELASGKIQGPTRLVDLADVTVPVMAIAGETDAIVPIPAAHHVESLLPSSPQVRLRTAPGGHLGVLTGTKAPATTWTYLKEFLADHDAAT